MPKPVGRPDTYAYNQRHACRISARDGASRWVGVPMHEHHTVRGYSGTTFTWVRRLTQYIACMAISPIGQIACFVAEFLFSGSMQLKTTFESLHTNYVC